MPIRDTPNVAGHGTSVDAMATDDTLGVARPDDEVSSGTDDTRSSASSTSKWPAILVVIATVIAVLSAATTWVRTAALDTDQWVSTSDRLLENGDHLGLALYLVDELYTQVDVAGGLESLLPAEFSGLAAPLAGALRDPATSGVERALTSDRFAAVWARANRRAHETLVAILATRPDRMCRQQTAR